MNSKLIDSLLVVVALASLALFLAGLLLEAVPLFTVLLTVAFLCLAIASYRSEKCKGFAYSLVVLSAVSVSMSIPQYFTHIGDFDTKGLIVPLLQIIMFGMGSQMSLKDLYGVVKMPYGVLAGVVLQFSIMPLVGFSVAKSFGFEPEIAAGIILVGSCSGGLASNVMAFLARANLALSITITTVGTLLAPFLTPFLMKFYAGELINVNQIGMMAGIFKMTIMPICAGLIFNMFSRSHAARSRLMQMGAYALIILLKAKLVSVASGGEEAVFGAPLLWDFFFFALLPIGLAFVFRTAAQGNKAVLDKILAFVSMLGIAVIIMVITAAGRDSLLSIGLALVFACLIHNIAGYLLGYAAGRFVLRLPERDCRTIAIEVGMQNGGLASGLASEMASFAKVGLAPAVFGPMMNITGSTLASWWRARPTSDENKADPAEV